MIRIGQLFFTMTLLGLLFLIASCAGDNEVMNNNVNNHENNHNLQNENNSNTNDKDLETLIVEAEDPNNTLTGNASVVDCPEERGCSGEEMVGNLYDGSSLQFNDIEVSEEGIYRLTIYYISGDPRDMMIQVNDQEPAHYSFPDTGDWDTIDTFEVGIELLKGKNTIIFDDNGGYSPDIDKIKLEKVEFGDNATKKDVQLENFGEQIEVKEIGTIKVAVYEQGFSVETLFYQVLYDLDLGLAAYEWGGKRIVTGVYSTTLIDDQLVRSVDFSNHQFDIERVKNIEDGHGKGIELVIENTEEGYPTFEQYYHIYEELPYFVTYLQMKDNQIIETNDIAPIVVQSMGGVDIGEYGDNRVLIVPFDNDKWSRYEAKTINTFLNTPHHQSAELTATYDNDSRHGLILGSITHDLWKTGISWSGSNDRLDQLKVYGGFTLESSTRDTLPHGNVSGTVIESPQIFVGFYEDYRDGLEAYGKANAAVAPPLAYSDKVPEGVPFGWNSWGAYAESLNYNDLVDVTNFFKEHIQENSFNNDGIVYINLDSYWDFLSEEELESIVELIRENGQVPGIYYGPFVYWGELMSQEVEGTDGQYTFQDIVLKDEKGEILPTIDGAYAVDPTHPGTKMRIDHHFNYFLELGFEYIKLDFLGHGSLEGDHYDQEVETGIQAYNLGMAYVNEVLNGEMFISASIDTLFPSQYAHSRRISTDIDGTLGLTEYQLNNLTYGWWQNGTIYHYTDPDYMTLAKGESFEAAQSRVNAAAISGTVFLNSDDVMDPVAQEYMKELLINPRINEVAAKGKAFRPVEGNTGRASADVFVLEEKGDFYVAIFNFTHNPVTKTVDLDRIGIPEGSSLEVIDLWTNEQWNVEADELVIDLKGAQSVLYKLQFE